MARTTEIRKQSGYEQGQRGDRQHWLADYAPLVKRIAQHMMAKLPASVELDDIVQAGMMGLLDAINRYEEAQGVQFQTYAVQRIRGAILDELRQADWLPRNTRRNMRAIERAMQVLEQELKRAPMEPEIAKQMGIPLAEYQEMLQNARGYQIVHYEDFRDSGDEHFLDRNCPDGRSAPLEALIDEELRSGLVAAIDTLPEREKLMMSLYYEEELNLREIGEVMGVSESRVCQIHTQVIARLRAKLRGGGK